MNKLVSLIALLTCSTIAVPAFINTPSVRQRPDQHEEGAPQHDSLLDEHKAIAEEFISFGSSATTTAGIP
jgi:hypothetical protein